jgi:hypothetical protein
VHSEVRARATPLLCSRPSVSLVRESAAEVGRSKLKERLSSRSNCVRGESSRNHGFVVMRWRSAARCKTHLLLLLMDVSMCRQGVGFLWWGLKLSLPLHKSTSGLAVNSPPSISHRLPPAPFSSNQHAVSPQNNSNIKY